MAVRPERAVEQATKLLQPRVVEVEKSPVQVAPISLKSLRVEVLERSTRLVQFALKKRSGQYKTGVSIAVDMPVLIICLNAILSRITCIC